MNKEGFTEESSGGAAAYGKAGNEKEKEKLEEEIMYIDIDNRLKVHLMEMTMEEAVALLEMIKGASLEHRRTFDKVKRELEMPIDKL